MKLFSTLSSYDLYVFLFLQKLFIIMHILHLNIKQENNHAISHGLLSTQLVVVIQLCLEFTFYPTLNTWNAELCLPPFLT